MAAASRPPLALLSGDEAFPDAAAAARAALAALQDRLGFAQWAVTRLRRGRHRVWVVRGRGYGLREGAASRWLDMHGRLLLAGAGPRLALDLRDAPGPAAAHAAVPPPRSVPLGALLGVPLRGPAGAPLGALCALDPFPQPAELRRELATVALLARLLATLSLREEGAAVGEHGQEASASGRQAGS